MRANARGLTEKESEIERERETPSTILSACHSERGKLVFGHVFLLCICVSHALTNSLYLSLLIVLHSAPFHSYHKRSWFLFLLIFSLSLSLCLFYYLSLFRYYLHNKRATLFELCVCVCVKRLLIFMRFCQTDFKYRARYNSVWAHYIRMEGKSCFVSTFSLWNLLIFFRAVDCVAMYVWCECSLTSICTVWMSILYHLMSFV